MKNFKTFCEFINEGFRVSPMQKILRDEFEGIIKKIILVEDDNGGLEITIMDINNSERGAGEASKIMQRLVDYANEKKLTLHLTPTNQLGSDVKRLTDFTKRFGFKKNNNRRKFDSSMIKLPD